MFSLKTRLSIEDFIQTENIGNTPHIQIEKNDGIVKHSLRININSYNDIVVEINETDKNINVFILHYSSAPKKQQMLDCFDSVEDAKIYIKYLVNYIRNKLIQDEVTTLLFLESKLKLQDYSISIFRNWGNLDKEYNATWITLRTNTLKKCIEIALMHSKIELYEIEDPENHWTTPPTITFDNLSEAHKYVVDYMLL